MSFVSNNFVVDSLERFKRFCDVVKIEYDVVTQFDGGSAEVMMWSDEHVEPPCTFLHPTENHEVEFDFHKELKGLLARDQEVWYRVEYEVEMMPSGEIEYLCDTMIGMPNHDEGDSDDQEGTDPGRVHEAAPGGAAQSW